MAALSEANKYTLYGAFFGACFPLGSILFLYIIGDLGETHGFVQLVSAAHRNTLLYVIDTAPLFLGLFARLAGLRQERLHRFSDSLEQQVGEKTRSLELALESERKAKDVSAHLAEHDPVTGLLNRRRFHKELDRWLLYAQRYHRVGTLIFIDLDNFKYVNDTYGHSTGDELLCHVSSLLTDHLRTTDFIARWGGDEFALLLPETIDKDATEVANKLLEIFMRNPLIVHGQKVRSSASIGLAYFPAHATNASDLVNYADAAMYEAKQSGRACWRLYSASDSETQRIQEHVQWEARIRRALENDQFILFYQPVIHVVSRKTYAYEALLRMEDRDGQMISPGKFLESAERIGLSVPIDFMVLRKAARRLLGLANEAESIIISLNLSEKTLQDKDLVTQVEIALCDNPILNGRIQFEVREGIALENLAAVRRLADCVKKFGGSIVLDDFGGGPTSFHQFRDIGIKIIKLDSNVSRELSATPDNQKFIKNITTIAHDYNIAVVAKFVEDLALLPLLQQLGVDYAQGFALGRPVESIEQVAIASALVN